MNNDKQPGDIDISGLDEAAVLAALWVGTQPLGLGFLQAQVVVTVDEAREWFKEYRARCNGPVHFDYVRGRPIKVTFDGDLLRFTRLYDRDAGEGAAQRVVDALRAAVQP